MERVCVCDPFSWMRIKLRQFTLILFKLVFIANNQQNMYARCEVLPTTMNGQISIGGGAKRRTHRIERMERNGTETIYSVNKMNRETNIH